MHRLARGNQSFLMIGTRDWWWASASCIISTYQLVVSISIIYHINLSYTVIIICHILSSTWVFRCHNPCLQSLDFLSWYIIIHHIILSTFHIISILSWYIINIPHIICCTQVTTLALEEDGSRLCLHQLAEKDQVLIADCDDQESGSILE